jgi:flagellar biogenesis protein FliO
MNWFGNWLTDVYLAVATEGPATLPPLTAPDFPFWQHLIKIITILSVMVGILLLALSLWKRLAPKYQRHPALIRVLATHYLAPKQALILVAVGEETFLLASSVSNLNVIPLAPGKAGVLPESLPPFATMKEQERES